jgi:hypothetical protein
VRRESLLDRLLLFHLSPMHSDAQLDAMRNESSPPGREGAVWRSAAEGTEIRI